MGLHKREKLNTQGGLRDKLEGGRSLVVDLRCRCIALHYRNCTLGLSLGFVTLTAGSDRLSVARPQKPSELALIVLVYLEFRHRERLLCQRRVYLGPDAHCVRRRLVMVSMAMRKPLFMPRWRSPRSGGSRGPSWKAFCGQLIFGSPRRSGKPLIADRGKVAGQSQLR